MARAIGLALAVIVVGFCAGGCRSEPMRLATSREFAMRPQDYGMYAPKPPPPPVVAPAPVPTAPAVRPPVAAPRPAQRPETTLVFVPPVKGNLYVTPRRQWKYIVVHHSAGDSGSAAAFDSWHRQRGWRGVGYHFVIGNGHGSGDGTIETTFRWSEQLTGAHAGVNEYNTWGIGICLVGDFNETVPSPKQLDALAFLVSYLQKRGGIPAGRVVGHRDVKQTDCPGRRFPWSQFVARLSE